MKRLLLGIALGLGIGVAWFGVQLAPDALAQVLPGAISTSPVVVPGSFNYNGGPQVSIVRAQGGTFTANSGTAVTVANTNITANSVILFGLKTAGGTPAAPFLVTVTPGTGFTVNSGGSDTSVYNYIIFG